jgi:hypothetical protein
VIGTFIISAGVPIVYGQVDAVEVDEHGVAQTVVTSDHMFTDRDRSSVGIYLHSLVRQNGQVIGKTHFEPICIVSNGHIVKMSGQTTLYISYYPPVTNIEASPMSSVAADLIIRHGTIIDGTGAARVRADVAVTRDLITAIGNLSPLAATQAALLAASLSPGDS